MKKLNLKKSPINEQFKASDPNYSVYVNASAGTGKTKVLIDRVIRLVITGSSLENIVCITFTNAAADEMLERLKARSSNWVFCSEEELKEELGCLMGKTPSEAEILRARKFCGNVINNFDKLKIQTIHSFCAGILGFSIGPNSEQKIFSVYEKKQLIKNSLENILSGENEGVLRSCIKALATTHDYNTIFEHVCYVIDQKIKFLRYISDIFSLEDIKKKVFKNFEISDEKDDQSIISEFILCVDFANLKDVVHRLGDYGESIALKMGDWLNYNQKIKNFNQFASVFLKNDGGKRIKIIKKNTANKEPSIEKLLKEIQCNVWDIDQKIRAYKSANGCAALFIVAAVVLNEYEASKGDNFDYDDILIRAIDLLQSEGQSSWVLQQLDISIHHILVDEAQDLSPIQWEVVKILSEEFFAGEGAVDVNRTVFIVGDMKQSIFGFQGADPGIFKQMCQYYEEKVTSVGKKWAQINLNTSFRSSANVLQVANSIFSRQEYSNMLGVDEYHLHAPYRKAIGKFELWPLIKNAEDKEEGDSEGWQMPQSAIDKKDKKILLARFISKTIKDWLESGRILEDKNKKISPSDIMIILRKRSSLYEYLTAIFKNLGIPVSFTASGDMSDHITVQDILSVIKFITNPNDDFNLACLLRSPFIGISEETLFEICYDRGEKSVWDVIKEKNDPIYQELMFSIEASSQNSIYDFLHTLFFEKEKIKNFVMRMGEQVTGIIDHFLDKVIEFEMVYVHRKFETFMEWFEKEKLELTKGEENGIQITTAHSAKGLQAPVVILADSSDSENTPNESFLWDEDKPFFSSGAQCDDIKIKKLKEKNRNNQYSESIRLLYVALTRAEDELYVCGWEAKKLQNSWYQVIKEAL